jgi:hypothetical protein
MESAEALVIVLQVHPLMIMETGIVDHIIRGSAMVSMDDHKLLVVNTTELVDEDEEIQRFVSWQEQRFSWLMELRRISKISRCEKRLLPTMKSSR